MIEGFFGEFLNRWIKDLGRYFPTKNGWLGEVASEVRLFHNLIMDDCF